MARKGKRLHIVPTRDKSWGVRPEGSKITQTAPTQAAAERLAREALQSSRNGGELITHRPDGRIRSSDTINRKDPLPPRDTEH